jgi:hypothetical protein
VPAYNSKGVKRHVTGNQIDKIGCDWNQRMRMFEIACAEGPPVNLTPHELIELGVELVLEGARAMTERRWQT